MTARLKIGRRLRRFGLPGTLGIGVWVMAASFYLSTVLPAQQRLDEVRASASLQQRGAQAGRQVDANARPPAEQLAEFYGLFPDETSSPDWIGRIAVIARDSGISLDQGEYKPTRDTVGQLTRLQMTLPLRGEYRQIRRFLTTTGAALPIVSLEQVQFERQKVGDPLIDARIRLVLYLGQAT